MYSNNESQLRLPRSSIFYAAIVVALLIIHSALAISSISNKSVTFDEILHLTGGYSYWLTNDYRLHPQNGNLPQRWAALPLLISDVKFPPLAQPAWWGSGAGPLGYQFFYKLGNDVQSMLWWGRFMIVLFSVLLGWIIFLWSRHLFGIAGGLVSLAFYAFSPTVLAHARLATSDMAVTLGFTASLGCLWIVMHRVNKLTVLTSGAVLGLLIVTKMSAVVIFPIALVLLLMREWIGRPLLCDWRGRSWIVDRGERMRIWGFVFAWHALISLAVVWAFYGFQFQTFRKYEDGRDGMQRDFYVQGIENEGLAGAAVVMANGLRLLPEGYLRGFCFVLRRAKVRRAFLNGQYSRIGWWYFFPYCLLVKTPIPVLFIALSGSATIIVRHVLQVPTNDERATKPPLSSIGWPAVRRILYHGAPLWVFFVIYWTLAIRSNLNIGHRHLLPTYPAMFVVAGGAAYLFQRKWKLLAVAVLGLFVWLVAESLMIWPHYLAYFNQLAGGPSKGYRHLVDSSLDWGQDLPGLRDWLKREGLAGEQETPVYLSYFGTGDADYYGIDVRPLPTFPDWNRKEYKTLTGGVYAVSATMLQSLYTQPLGPWCEPYEHQYQQLRQEESQFQRFNNDASFRETVEGNRESHQLFVENRNLFLELRFARLCGFLRQREPNAQIGHSILIYRLTDEDVQQALHGKPAELEPEVRVKGNS